jgi:hypothetical protein
MKLCLNIFAQTISGGFMKRSLVRFIMITTILNFLEGNNIALANNPSFKESSTRGAETNSRETTQATGNISTGPSNMRRPATKAVGEAINESRAMEAQNTDALCTTANGRTLSPNDVGYNECIVTKRSPRR